MGFLFRTAEKRQFGLWDAVTLVSVICISILLPDYTSVQNNLRNEANLLNNTHHANKSFVFFNRVPKAGTETLWSLIDFLSR